MTYRTKGTKSCMLDDSVKAKELDNQGLRLSKILSRLTSLHYQIYNSEDMVTSFLTLTREKGQASQMEQIKIPQVYLCYILKHILAKYQVYLITYYHSSVFVQSLNYNTD